MGIMTGLQSTCVKLDCREKLKRQTKIRKMLNLKSYTYYGTGRDVCTDNFFTNFNLAKLLLDKSLTIFGTTRNHRREIPHSFKQPNAVVLIHVSLQS